MLSESQERMLVIAKKGFEGKVRALFERWELRSDVIGEVTDDGMARIVDGTHEVACVPVAELTRPPQYRREGIEPDWLQGLQQANLSALADLNQAVPPLDALHNAAPESRHASGAQALAAAGSAAGRALLSLLGSENIASKRWIYRQYDHQVLTNTVVAPGAGDAAVLRLRGTRRGIALTTDCNGRYCYLDPYAGGAIAVAEAARNVVCSGARPLAVTDCLNFGNPEKLDVYFQLEQSIRGMAAACSALGTPVISGNVSLYNETNGVAVYPTPVVGMLGVLDDVEQRLGMGFSRPGDEVYLLAPPEAVAGSALLGAARFLGGSEYLNVLHSTVAGRPQIDLEVEKRVQAVCLEAAQRGLLSAAHDCSDGGLAVALAECCIAGVAGLDASSVVIEGRLDAALFGEQQSRILVALMPASVEPLRAIAAEHGVAAIRLGSTGGDRLLLGGLVDLAVAELREAYDRGIPAHLSA
jgi:phosphoribosylformylglycinamidine synthase